MHNRLVYPPITGMHRELIRESMHDDMLNQITVVKSGLDVIEEDYEEENPNKQVLSLIRSAVRNIREQVGFSAPYDQMGVQQSI